MIGMAYELFDEIAKIFCENNELKSFCSEKYGKNFCVYIGIKPEEEPESLEYPILAITEISQDDKGDGKPEESVDIVITAAIEQSKVDDSTVINEIKIVKNVGLQEVEAFRELAKNAILKKHGLGFKISGSGKTIPENFYPFFTSTMVITFSRPKMKRDGRGV